MHVCWEAYNPPAKTVFSSYTWVGQQLTVPVAQSAGASMFSAAQTSLRLWWHQGAPLNNYKAVADVAAVKV